MKMSLNISRDSNNKIGIEVRDELSRNTFLELNLTLEQFALAITGMYLGEVDGKVHNLDAVGKEKITENRSVILPDYFKNIYDKKQHQDYLINNCQEDGWVINTYLGSQNSITYNSHGDKIANYSVYKYVDVEED